MNLYLTDFLTHLTIIPIAFDKKTNLCMNCSSECAMGKCVFIEGSEYCLKCEKDESYLFIYKGQSNN